MTDLVFLGPSDNLFLEEGGQEYHPGDVVPMTDLQLYSAQRSGQRFAEVKNKDEAATVRAMVRPNDIRNLVPAPVPSFADLGLPATAAPARAEARPSAPARKARPSRSRKKPAAEQPKAGVDVTLPVPESV